MVGYLTNYQCYSIPVCHWCTQKVHISLTFYKITSLEHVEWQVNQHAHISFNQFRLSEFCNGLEPVGGTCGWNCEIDSKYIVWTIHKIHQLRDVYALILALSPHKLSNLFLNQTVLGKENIHLAFSVVKGGWDPTFSAWVSPSKGIL